MIYDFQCEKCELGFEIVCTVKEYTGKYKCQSCGNLATRIYTTFYHHGGKLENAEYNVGLGKVTKSKNHRKELAKRMNLVEIGNEKPDTIHKEDEATLSDKLKRRWDTD